ncbi:hypothetical protein [Prescottella equi]
MITFSATEVMGTGIRECSARYLKECFLHDSSGIVRVEYRDGAVEYIAGTRHDLSRLRWEPRPADNVIELISTGIVVRELAGDVGIRRAMVAELERDSGLSFR